MSSIYVISYFKRKINDDILTELNSFSVGSWIDVINPTKEEINFLCKKFNLDENNLLSGLDENEIPRIEFEDDHVYLFVKDIVDEEIITLLIVIGRNFVLTLSKQKLESLDEIKNNVITTQRIKMIIKILWILNKRFEKKTSDIVKKIRFSEKKFKLLKEEEVNKLLRYEGILNSFVFYYSHMLVLYNRMIKKIKLYEEDKEILEDLIIEANENFNLAKTSLKTISSIRDHYMIILSNKLNRVITVLTIVTIFISIPAAISGIYGMNIKLPLQEDPFAFYYIIILIILLWAGFILYLRKALY